MCKSANKPTGDREEKKHEEREWEKRVKGYCFAIYVDFDTLHYNNERKFSPKKKFFTFE